MTRFVYNILVWINGRERADKIEVALFHRLASGRHRVMEKFAEEES